MVLDQFGDDDVTSIILPQGFFETLGNPRNGRFADPTGHLPLFCLCPHAIRPLADGEKNGILIRKEISEPTVSAESGIDSGGLDYSDGELLFYHSLQIDSTFLFYEIALVSVFSLDRDKTGASKLCLGRTRAKYDKNQKEESGSNLHGRILRNQETESAALTAEERSLIYRQQ